MSHSGHSSSGNTLSQARRSTSGAIGARSDASTTVVAPCKTASRQPSTGTLGKAMEVLDLIAMAPAPIRFTEILNALGQPRGTLHRQLTNLVEEGLVILNPDHSYSAGFRLLKLAARAWSQNSFRSIAEPHVRALQERTGETVHLGVLSGVEVIYVDKLESRQNVRMHSQVGNASPVYCTGIGKAMLALLPEDECRARVQQIQFVKHTPTTLHTPKLLLAELETIRATGISYDREEHEPGIRCVASGILGKDMNTIAGVSVTGPAYRIADDTMAEWETLVAQTARSIEEDIAFMLGPRSQE